MNQIKMIEYQAMNTCRSIAGFIVIKATCRKSVPH